MGKTTYIGRHLRCYLMNDNEHDFPEGDPRHERSALTNGRLNATWDYSTASEWGEGPIAHFLDAEWHFPAKWLFASLSVNGETFSQHPIKLSFGAGFYVYLGIGDIIRDFAIVRTLFDKLPKERRELSISLFEGSIHWRVFTRPHEWHKSTPRWREGHLEPAAVLFGKMQFTQHEIERRTSIPFSIAHVDGGTEIYHLTATRELCIWQRERWPFSFGPSFLYRSMSRVELTVEEKSGIPTPGKGENSWDCDDDATFSMTCAADNIEDALGKLMASIIKRRQQYGGHDWKPRAKEEEATHAE